MQERETQERETGTMMRLYETRWITCTLDSLKEELGDQESTEVIYRTLSMLSGSGRRIDEEFLRALGENMQYLDDRGIMVMTKTIHEYVNGEIATYYGPHWERPAEYVNYQALKKGGLTKNVLIGIRTKTVG